MAYAVNYNEPFVRLRPTSRTAEIFRKITQEVIV
jgi:hypothetical protein